MIRLDLNGRPVSLDREVAVQLREAAARWAAKSSTVRDLSLILDQAIRTGRVVALQRQELRRSPRFSEASKTERISPNCVTCSTGRPTSRRTERASLWR